MHDILLPKKITFLIDSSLNNVSLVGVAVRGICNYLSISEKDTYYLELCVVEAVNNVIKHAYDSEAGHAVAISITCSNNDMTFEISDSGKKMTGQWPCSLDFDSEDLCSIPEHGMGLFIIDSVMDEVTYRSDCDKNTLTMHKYFHYKN
ncbi:MAG: Serine-protein kinase RsbW [Syntrophorhabdus sp. PtaU1.Bin058]|nr:MAG: Serine-protein kinase RsbW [Syntrophorhabdus sp. PtaU1.Bin058]